MLTHEQRAHYEDWGHVRIPQAFSRDAAAAMADFIWARLSDLHAIRQEDQRTWAVDAPWVGLNRFKDAPVFQPLASPALCTAIDDVLGPGKWNKPKSDRPRFMLGKDIFALAADERKIHDSSR